MVGENDLIDPVNITNRIPIAVQHQCGHGLLLLKFRHLARELFDLLVEFVGLWNLRRHWRVVMKHRHRSGEQHHAQNGLDHLLPGVADLVRFLRKLWFGHERSSSFVPQAFTTVRKMMYRRCRKCREKESWSQICWEMTARTRCERRLMKGTG